jgi:hypothetical protein
MTPFGWSTMTLAPEEIGVADANAILLRCGVPEQSITRG